MPQFLYHFKMRATLSLYKIALIRRQDRFIVKFTATMRLFASRAFSFLFSKKLNRGEMIVLAALLLGGFTRNIGAVGFSGDENFWIVSSIRLDAFLAGDFDSPIWTEDPTIAYEVRPVPSYFAAIGQRLGGVQPRDLPNAYWLWGLSEAENAARNAMPTETVLWWSRIPMAVITALGLWGFAVFLGQIHSRFAAYVFTCICFNGYFLENLRRAMSEPSVLFFTILVILASRQLMVALRNNSLKLVILWAVVMGIFSGLAGESKLTGLACEIGRAHV